MIFAYLLCIMSGLILGSFQLLRLNIISQLGYDHIEPTYYERSLGLPTFLLVLLTIPVIAAICYAEPWVFVDNFVTGEENPAVIQFSLFRALTFLSFLVVGELFVDFFNYQEAKKNQAQQYERRKSKPEYKYNSNMDEWINWRRSRAGNAHPDWTPPDSHQAKSQSSKTAYIDPKRRQNLQILNMPNGASAKDIHRQYLKLAKQYHPDKYMMMPDSAPDLKRAEEKMKNINAAYEWLKNNP